MAYLDQMNRFVALLRAVNVGGTGKLPMSDLVTICHDAGFEAIKTYIASGNVVFSTTLDAISAGNALEAGVAAYAGKPVGIFIRDADQMREILLQNPFADRPPNSTTTVFLDHNPDQAMLTQITGHKDEELALGAREIYVHYPSGMGQSKLKIIGAQSGTARNMNTVAKLTQMLRDDP